MALTSASSAPSALRHCRRSAGAILAIAGALAFATTATMEAFTGSSRPRAASARLEVTGSRVAVPALAGAAGLDDFKAALQEGMPFVVDFTSQWCGPCKLMNKVLDGVIPEFEGRVRVLKLDVERNARLAGSFGVQKVPTLLLFTSGSTVPVHTFTGLAKGEDISAAIQKQLLG